MGNVFRREAHGLEGLVDYQVIAEVATQQRATVRDANG
jgi:hypothetical protein